MHHSNIAQCKITQTLSPDRCPNCNRPCSGHTVALTSLYQHMAALLSPCSAYRACHALSCCVARGNLQEMDTFTHALRQPHIRPVPAHCCIPLPAVSLQSLSPFAVLRCAVCCNLQKMETCTYTLSQPELRAPSHAAMLAAIEHPCRTCATHGSP